MARCLGLLCLGLGFTPSATPLPSIPSRALSPLDPRFGLIEPHDAPARADALRVGWGRVRFHWALVQPTGPNDWVDAEITDRELAHEIQSGREVLGLLIGLPGWATGADGLPQGLYLAPSDPGNSWATFVREVVSRYRGRIDHWVIWNEPDVWDSSHPGYTWAGDEADYVQLLKVAYLVAREANPQAVIHLAAVTHWWDVLYGRELYFERLMEALITEPEAAEHNHYYDAVTLHLYFNPANVYEVIEQYGRIQAEHGLDKPIWLVETNAAPSSDPAWIVAEPTFRVSLVEQAAYMPQVLSLALAAGAARVGIYKLIDTPGDYAANPEPFGLVRGDDSPRPAYRTAQVAIEQLAGARGAEWTDRGVVAQVVVEKPGQLVRILWSRVPTAQEVRIPAASSVATLIDMWGNQLQIRPQDGFYSIVLLGGECQQTTGDYCMIGGPPVYLVETATHVIATGELTVQYRTFDGSLSRASSPRPRNGLLQWGGAMAGVFLIAAVGLAFRLRSAHS